MVKLNFRSGSNQSSALNTIAKHIQHGNWAQYPDQLQKGKNIPHQNQYAQYILISGTQRHPNQQGHCFMKIFRSMKTKTGIFLHFHEANFFQIADKCMKRSMSIQQVTIHGVFRVFENDSIQLKCDPLLQCEAWLLNDLYYLTHDFYNDCDQVQIHWCGLCILPLHISFRRSQPQLAVFTFPDWLKKIASALLSFSDVLWKHWIWKPCTIARSLVHHGCFQFFWKGKPYFPYTVLYSCWFHASTYACPQNQNATSSYWYRAGPSPTNMNRGEQAPWLTLIVRGKQLLPSIHCAFTFLSLSKLWLELLKDNVVWNAIIIVGFQKKGSKSPIEGHSGTISIQWSVYLWTWERLWLCSLLTSRQAFSSIWISFSLFYRGFENLNVAIVRFLSFWSRILRKILFIYKDFDTYRHKLHSIFKLNCTVVVTLGFHLLH